MKELYQPDIFESMILSKKEAELIKRKRKEKANYNKMISKKPTSYTSKRSPTDKIRFMFADGCLMFADGCLKCGSYNIKTKGITQTCLNCGNIIQSKTSGQRITLSNKNRTKCDVRNEKGDVWCADSCIDRDTCPYSAK